MKYYLVFGSVKRPRGFMGGTFLDWGQPPIGVYSGETAKEACHAAAKDSGQMATYFAIEGYPWGIDLMDSSATQLGRSETADERMGRILDRMEANDAAIRELREGEVPSADDE